MVFYDLMCVESPTPPPPLPCSSFLVNLPHLHHTASLFLIPRKRNHQEPVLSQNPRVYSWRLAYWSPENWFTCHDSRKESLGKLTGSAIDLFIRNHRGSVARSLYYDTTDLARGLPPPLSSGRWHVTGLSICMNGEIPLHSLLTGFALVGYVIHHSDCRHLPVSNSPAPTHILPPWTESPSLPPHPLSVCNKQTQDEKKRMRIATCNVMGRFRC
jgi:hypothetical protein